MINATFPSFAGRNRWVIYNEKHNHEYDGSMIPAEWFGWMHYKTDTPPTVVSDDIWNARFFFGAPPRDSRNLMSVFGSVAGQRRVNNVRIGSRYRLGGIATRKVSTDILSGSVPPLLLFYRSHKRKENISTKNRAFPVVHAVSVI